MSDKTKTRLVLPKELLKSVDSLRSLFIAEAAKEKIEREKQQSMLPLIREKG